MRIWLRPGPHERAQHHHGHAVAAVLSATTPAPQVREALARLPGVGEVQMFGAPGITACVSGCAPDRMNALNITT
ncbi:hypothetical protein EVG17_28735, partial [Klebsiella pneumoniae]